MKGALATFLLDDPAIGHSNDGLAFRESPTLQNEREQRMRNWQSSLVLHLLSHENRYSGYGLDHRADTCPNPTAGSR